MFNGGDDMAYFRERITAEKVKFPLIKMGSGENTSFTPFDIEKSESSYSRNTSSRNFPALSVRPGKAKQFSTDSTPLTSPNGLSQRNNQYPHIHHGTAWKRWDGSAWQSVATVANARSKILEFNTETVRYTILVDGTNRKAYDGTTVTDLTNAPQTNLYAIDDLRLYALKGSVLKCSAAGSISDWTTIDDADTITITSMVGTGTAIAVYNDQVICWSDQSMHILFGDDPGNFSLSDPIEDGCIAERTTIIHNGILYFLDYGKFKQFTTGLPIDISQKVKTYLEGIKISLKNLCCTGKDGKYIYLSIPYGSSATTNNITLEYDTDYRTWYVHDKGFMDFVNIGEAFYGVDPDGVIWRINNGTTDQSTAIAWEHITGCWNEGSISQKKSVSDIWMIVDLPSGSTLTVSYSTSVDGNDFTTLKSVTASSSEQNVRVQIPSSQLQGFDWYRLKFSGEGPCTIHAIEPYFRIISR